MRLVGIEEHVNRANVMERMTYLPEALRAKLLPSVEQRISDMDAARISVEVLSAPITAPGPDGAADPLAPVMPPYSGNYRAAPVAEHGNGSCRSGTWLLDVERD
jgi:hypothetical protein